MLNESVLKLTRAIDKTLTVEDVVTVVSRNTRMQLENTNAP